MFTDLVGGVCRGVYNAGKNVVVSSGQMVRTGWRLMSGSHTFREAVGAPDSGIPLVSGWAQDLERTANRRNEAIAQSIASGDSQEGWIPYDQIPGSTPEEKALNYRNLPEDDPLKKEAHENFLLWNEDGWDDCLTTLKDASKTGVKAYGEAVSGSGVLVEVTEQLTTTGQNPEDKAPVTPVVEDKETSTQIDEPKTMIISKRNQPESEPKIVVLEGVDPVFEVELPEGTYDIISEQVSDGAINPGELLTLELDIQNGGDNPVTGDVNVTGLGGITVGSGSHTAVSIPGGSIVSRQITVQLPADYSDNTAGLQFDFSMDSQVVSSFEIELDVSFYVELNTIYSPVTDRVLNLSGKVANPSIGTAHLVVDGDYEQVYEVQVGVDGNFVQEIIVEASTEEVEHEVGIMADSGSWHEEDFAAFTSQVPPTGFRVTLTWDTGGTDVDLWVTDPFGTKCYFGNSYVEASGLRLDTDDTNGYGPETISSEAPPYGDYFVQVHYWSDHDSENAIGTNCTIRIVENEGTEDETVRYYYGFLGDSGDIWDVTTVDVGGRSAASGEAIDHYHWIDPATLPAK